MGRRRRKDCARRSSRRCRLGLRFPGRSPPQPVAHQERGLDRGAGHSPYSEPGSPHPNDAKSPPSAVRDSVCDTGPVRWFSRHRDTPRTTFRKLARGRTPLFISQSEPISPKSPLKARPRSSTSLASTPAPAGISGPWVVRQCNSRSAATRGDRHDVRGGVCIESDVHHGSAVEGGCCAAAR